MTASHLNCAIRRPTKICWKSASSACPRDEALVSHRPRRVVTWDDIHQHGKADLHWDEVCVLAAEIEAGRFANS